jgi:IS30 family transposase
LALSLREREEISRGIVAGHSLRTIAQALGRSPSTVSREVHRNGGCCEYRASTADQAAWDRALRPKRCKLVENRALARIVATKLRRWWSPEQIAGWLKRHYPEDENGQVSHETIYRSLFIQARGALKKELLGHLRSRRAMPGHWEGDLIFGSKNSQIATLVERHTRYVLLAKVDGKDTETVINALIKQAHKLPSELYKSLTWDRGHEMADHQRFSLSTDIEVFFCDPHSPWQRGSNENTNGLLRQYFPKGTDLSVHSQGKLSAVARQLNERPRETLEFESPAERFSACVASTG